jgi:D-alanyl-D-alanine carboxypeptidase
MIAKYAMTLDNYREVVKEVKYTIPKTNKQDERNYITNSNKLIWKTYDKFRYEYATGIKTGYTVKAKHCLVGGAKKGDMELISVIMGADGPNIYSDTVALFEYGFANYQNVQVLKKDQIVTTVSIKDGKEKINLLAAEDFSVMLSQAERDKVKTEIKTDTAGKESVKKGDVLGKMLVYVDGKKVKEINLLSSVGIGVPDVKKTRNFGWLWLVAGFLLYRTVVTLINVRRRKHNNLSFSKKRKGKKTTYIKR